MTKARVRECPKCKAEFFKIEGCNKMTCRCGAKMCYICRAQIKDYKHFCQIPHCNHKTCNKCVLFSDGLADDRLAMKEAGLNALQEVGTGGDDEVNVDVIGLLEGGDIKAKKRQRIRY